MARVSDGTADAVVAELSRRGFVDPTTAGRRVQELGQHGVGVRDDVLVSFSLSADPDLALHSLTRIIASFPETGAAGAMPWDDKDFVGRLTALLGVSEALADHLVRHPADLRLLAGDQLTTTRPTAQAMRSALLTSVGAEPQATIPVASGKDLLDRLRVTYRRMLLQVAVRDLAAGLAVEDVAAELADLAAAALDAALAIARSEISPQTSPVRLAVIGLGKCGGHELNYVSDVDVVYVAEPVSGGDEEAALRAGALLAAGVARVCSAVTSEGSLWEVDAALRPEGRAGPLVRTLASFEAYYQRWAKTWEFQALLKARPVAGDMELGRAFTATVAPLVWQSSARPDFVEDVQSMRQRVESQIPAREVGRQLKLGPGGLRDVEFSVQLLQLVHGRTDESLRSGNTLAALAALAAGGYVGRDDAQSLDQAYRFLRTLEHRIQLHRLRRTHLMPNDPGNLRRLGRSVGLRREPVAELTEQWRRHAREVRRLHEKLFYRPLLNAVARLGEGERRLAPEAAQERMEALGYRDPAGALRHIEALTAGVSRRAAIQRTLLPVMLGWFADAGDPDAGLFGFRQVSDALGSTHWYLALLRDAGATAERLARLLASSRYTTELLLRAPDAVTMLADDSELQPRTRSALDLEMISAAQRSEDPETAVAAVRGIRRRELFRIAAGNVLGHLDESQLATALTDVAEAVVSSVFGVAEAAVTGSGSVANGRLAVIAMGSFGGRELGLASDLDVMFVNEPATGVPDAEATEQALRVANELRRLLTIPAADPPVVLDPDLRPEGRSGPLVRSLGAYAAYYARWSLVWESQALLRATCVAGDPDVGRRFLEVADEYRWPEGGLAEDKMREIRRLKARVEAERLPRGADPTLHTKLGRGGLADVEWTVQLLQLRHGWRVSGLRTPGTLAALAAAVEAGLVTATDAETLRRSWLLATRVRNAVVLVRGRSEDTVPSDLRDLAGVARLVGYPAGAPGELLEDYRRVTRRARAVVERVFYG